MSFPFYRGWLILLAAVQGGRRQMPKSRKKERSPKRVLTLPDLEQSKTAFLNSLTSKSGQRSYDHAITDFVEWYCSEARLAFNRTVANRNTTRRMGQGGGRRVKGGQRHHRRHALSIDQQGWESLGQRNDSEGPWEVVREGASRAGIEKLAPYDLRRTCARLCHLAGGESDQIQFLLGHLSIQSTERYLGCK